MEITDRFRVSTPIDETWKVLLDIERIAPCLPGAQLEEIDGDEFRGVVKVKVGPITAQYKGAARLAEVDEAGRRIVIDASGRDTRGQGNASAKILVTMTGDESGTEVSVHTDLSITGKVAQFGRGVLGDVSAKLLGQFVERLEADVLGGDGGGAAPTSVDDGRAFRGRLRGPVFHRSTAGARAAAHRECRSRAGRPARDGRCTGRPPADTGRHRRARRVRAVPSVAPSPVMRTR